MKVVEIAQRISAHLVRFENDPKINAGWRIDKTTGEKIEDPRGLRDYYNASARASGRFVSVVYVSYQGSCSLTKDDAIKYLAWLDAGHVGTHDEAARSKDKP